MAAPLEHRLVDGRGSSREPTAGELRGLNQLAKKRGQDVSVLVERYRDLNEFSVIATALEEKFPTEFLRAGVSQEGQAGNYWLLFTEAPPASALSGLESLSVDTDLITGAPGNKNELNVVLQEIAKSLSAHEGVFSSISPGLTYDGMTLSIQYSFGPNKRPSEDEKNAMFAEALRAGSAKSVDGKLPLPATFEALPDGLVKKGGQTVRGGKDLYTAPSWLCTSGFTVTRSGVLGVITARHCVDPPTYGSPSAISGTVVNAAANPGEWVDLQFQATVSGNTTVPEFRAYSTSGTGIEDVNSVANSVVGAIICKWGWGSEQAAPGTGYDCTTVADTGLPCDYGWDFTSNGVCGLDRLDENIFTPGDSGGPNFYFTQARGTYTGTDGVYAWITRIGRVTYSLSATVNT